MVEGTSFRLTDEVRYVQRRAAACDGRIVTIGQLLLFSTDTGDAWLLDRSDQLATRLARNGEAEPIDIEETDYCARHRVEGPLSHRWTGVRVLGSRQRAHRHNPRIPNRQARCDGLVGKFQICLARQTGTFVAACGLRVREERPVAVTGNQALTPRGANASL